MMNPKSLSPIEARPPCQPPAVLRAEIEAYERSARVSTWTNPRYRMTYRTLGSGPPLILVPGIAGTYRGYALLLNRLSEHFTTTIYDYPGEASNDAARLGRIRHEHLCDDLAGLVEHLGYGHAFAFGLSFGSTVTLGALARSPERFRRAAVQGAFARRVYTPAERAALFVGRRFPGTVAALPLREKVLTWNNKSAFPAVLADRWTDYLADNARTPIASLAHRCDILSALDLRASLRAIQCEVLLIQGNEDRIIPKSNFELLRSLLPRVTAQLLPLVGHQAHYTHPELLARLVTEFFLGGSSSSPG
jgi:pimeloyl-ACP methyl ester carboxylesterase